MAGRFISWSDELDRAIARIVGPEDEPDLECNGDPDSLNGEEADVPAFFGFDDEDFLGEDEDDEEDGDC